MISNNSWNERRVLVTGATGLVGSWLVKALVDQGAHVVAFVRDLEPNSEFTRSGICQKVSIANGELEDYKAIERAVNENEVSVVFHLGAQAIVSTARRSPLATMESNIRGTYNVLEACRVHRELVEAVIVASSDKAYGESSQLPYVETMRLAGTQPYEVSKSCADLISQSYYSTYELPIAIARCGNIYGGGDLNWNRIIPGTIRACLQGLAPVIRSDGTFVRDYVYVKDVVSAYICMADSLLTKSVIGEAFNISPAKAYSVVEIVEAIQKTSNCVHLPPIIENRAKGEIHSQYLDGDKTQRLLGWHPSFSLEQGLVETIAWYSAYLKIDNAQNGQSNKGNVCHA
jgi:CDP-glucose 4,6-dehydratase